MLALPEHYLQCSKILEQHAEPNGTIYHYTNWRGLKGILTSQQLWLSSYRHLNDTSEIKHAVHIIREHALNNCKDYNMELYLGDFFSDIEDLISKTTDFFICSFCAEQNYLYAWRAYANDGAGFSLGFKKEFFTGSTAMPDPNTPSFGRGSIFYTYDDILMEISDLTAIVQKDLENNDAFSNHKDALAARLRIAKYFLATLLPYLSSIKHQAYKEEREYRIYTRMDEANTTQTFFTASEDTESPHLNSKKRVYYTFDIQHVSEIWIGPRLNFEHAKYDIMVLLDSLKTKGYHVNDIQILRSGIPYKNFS